MVRSLSCDRSQAAYGPRRLLALEPLNELLTMVATINNKLIGLPSKQWWIQDLRKGVSKCMGEAHMAAAGGAV